MGGESELATLFVEDGNEVVGENVAIGICGGTRCFWTTAMLLHPLGSNTETIGGVVDHSAGKVLDAEHAQVGWGGFGLEEPAVVLVLESDLLDIGFRGAAGAALHVQHTQQARPLFERTRWTWKRNRWMKGWIERFVPAKRWGRCKARYRRSPAPIHTGSLPHGTTRCSTWRCACWRNAASSRRTSWCTNASNWLGCVGKTLVSGKRERRANELWAKWNKTKKEITFGSSKPNIVEDTDKSIGGVPDGHWTAGAGRAYCRCVLTGHFGLVVHGIVGIGAERARHAQSLQAVGPSHDSGNRPAIKRLCQGVSRSSRLNKQKKGVVITCNSAEWTRYIPCWRRKSTWRVARGRCGCAWWDREVTRPESHPKVRRRL